MTVIDVPASWWSRQLEMVYQPVVDLDTRAVVGYEALARGPVDSPVHSPAALFTAARALGVLADADVACRTEAVRGALRAGLPDGLQLFVNVEPEALRAPGPPAVLAAARDLSVVVELTERGLTADPAALLRAAAGARRHGFGLAVDDVGADRTSLALLPFLRPDVIKLDLAVVQAQTCVAVADVITAVTAAAERTGAVVLAEGIETEEQAAKAAMMGARLGQGWLFGKPEPLPQFDPVPARAGAGHRRRGAEPVGPGAPRPASTAPATPFELVADSPELRPATPALLHALAEVVERQAAAVGGPAVLVSALGHRHHLGGAVLRRYADLAERAALVVACGVDVPASPAGKVRGVRLAPDDPLRHEWDVVVVGPHVAVALLSRATGETGPDGEPLHAYRMTHDRDLVVEAATRLLLRVPSPPA